MSEAPTYQHYINSEFARRCETNPSYSLRSFARALGVDPGALSRVLNGKQALSFKAAKKVAHGLGLTPDQENEFFSSLLKFQQNRSLKKIHASNLQEKQFKGDDLAIDYYRVITDWYHIAIIEMTYLKDFEPNARYLSKKLGIGSSEAKLALERLLKLGLLKKRNGKLVKSKEKLSTADRHLTTPALRKNQKQFLEKAIYSLENDPIEIRSNTNMVMAIDSSKIEVAKQMIREFQMMLSNFLESGKQDQVYNLSVALNPVQKG